MYYAEWEHGDSSTHSRYVTTFYICAPWKLLLNNTKLPERFQVLICPLIFILLNQFCQQLSFAEDTVQSCPRACSYVQLLAVERWEQRLPEEGYTAAYNLLPPLSQFSKELILSWRADFTKSILSNFVIKFCRLYHPLSERQHVLISDNWLKLLVAIISNNWLEGSKDMIVQIAEHE